MRTGSAICPEGPWSGGMNERDPKNCLKGATASRGKDLRIICIIIKDRYFAHFNFNNLLFLVNQLTMNYGIIGLCAISLTWPLTLCAQGKVILRLDHDSVKEINLSASDTVATMYRMISLIKSDSTYYNSIADLKVESIIAYHTKFECRGNFENTTFNETSIGFSEFMRGSSFNGCKFKSKATFLGSKFDSALDFATVDFNKEADFNFCEFEQNVNFEKTKFNKAVVFEGSVFGSTANFLGASFHDVSFSWSKFKNKAIFVAIEVPDTSNIDFTETKLPDTLDFSFVEKLHTNIDFTFCDFDVTTSQPRLIQFYKTDISKFKLDYTHFKLLIPDSILNPIDHIKRPTVIDEIESVYEALLNNFKIHGQTESYKLLDIEYQRYEWSNSWAGFMPCLPYYWNRFGYRKEFVFVWTLCMLFIFTIINFWLLDYLNQQVYLIGEIPWADGIKNNRRRWWYSFIYTSTIFFRLTLKTENIKFQRIAGSIYIFLIYTLGVVCLAYMAALVLGK